MKYGVVSNWTLYTKFYKTTIFDNSLLKSIKEFNSNIGRLLKIITFHFSLSTSSFFLSNEQ